MTVTTSTEAQEVSLELGCQQLAKCFLRTPVPTVPTKRCRVRINESNQHFRHDPAANWTKTMTSCTGIGLAENVVPQRSLAVPTCGGDANLLRAKRGDSEVTRHGLARREPDTLAALQITDSE